MLPEQFKEQYVWVYCKKDDELSCKAARRYKSQCGLFCECVNQVLMCNLAISLAHALIFHSTFCSGVPRKG